MRTTDLENDICPKCGYLLEAATDMESDKRPSPGDWAVCINCATVLRFDENLRHQLHVGEIPPELHRYRQAVLAMKGLRESDLQ